MQKLNLANYYLDLTKYFQLGDTDKNKVMNLYQDMLSHNHDGRYEMAHSFYNTLSENGFLINLLQKNRAQNISEVLNEEI